MDLTDPDGPERLVAAARQELGELDLLVNNVGGGEGDATAGFLDVDRELSHRRSRVVPRASYP